MRDDPVSTPRILIVMTTVGTQEQALDIANHLVDKRLAACVNIVPGVRSIFRWKGEVIDDTEFLLLAKTVEERYEEVSAAIKSLHAYELPEILAYPAPLADGPFAAWVGGATNRVEGSRGRSRK
jgi:periplasmic divalent cation tolerance protein